MTVRLQFKIKMLISALCLAVVLAPCGAQTITTTIEPYTKNEFPQWARDLRRLEIISIGSLPFVTLSVTLGFSIYKWISHDFDTAYTPNPLNKSAASMTHDEQMQVLVLSLSISALFGLTDFVITLIKRQVERKRLATASGVIAVEQLSDTPPPDATPPPSGDEE